MKLYRFERDECVAYADERGKKVAQDHVGDRMFSGYMNDMSTLATYTYRGKTIKHWNNDRGIRIYVNGEFSEEDAIGFLAWLKIR